MATTSTETARIRPPRWVRAVDGLSQASMAVSGVAVVVLGGHIALDLLYRSVTESRLQGTLEYTTYWWLPLMVFLALGGGQLYEEHLRVTVLLDRARPAVRRAVDTLAYLLSSLSIAVLIYYAVLGAQTSLQLREVTNASTQISVWPFKWLAVLGLVVLLLQTLVTILRVLGLVPPGKHDEAAELMQGEL